jgi:hypothetical protein
MMERYGREEYSLLYGIRAEDEEEKAWTIALC